MLKLNKFKTEFQFLFLSIVVAICCENWLSSLLIKESFTDCRVKWG